MTQKADVRTQSGLIKDPAHLQHFLSTPSTCKAFRACYELFQLVWLISHVLESIGNSPDRDDVGELSLRGLLPSVDAHPTHRAGHQAKKEEKVKEHF